MAIYLPKCPHCKSRLIYQPAAVQWWCSGCRLSYSLDRAKTFKHDTIPSAKP